MSIVETLVFAWTGAATVNKSVTNIGKVFNMVAGAERSAETQTTSRLVDTKSLVKSDHYHGEKEKSMSGNGNFMWQ